MDVFPVDWLARDVEQNGVTHYVITVFGKTPDARLVAAHIAFYPYCYVALPPGSGVGQTKLFITQAVTKHQAIQKYCRVVERVSLWGFTNSTRVQLVQLAFPSLKKLKWAARAYQRDGVATYESGIDPLLRFFHIRDIAPASWIRVASFTHVPDDLRATRAPLEVSTGFDRVGPSTLTARPPLVLGSWDLETHSESRKFPCATNEEDVIIQIATSFQRYGEPEPYRQLIMAFRDTDPVDGMDVISFEDEADMINAWCDEVLREGVDCLLGYNTDQFDWRYVYGRSLVLVDDDTGESRVDLDRLGRMLKGGGALQERELNSGAYGQNKFCSLATPGVLQLDLLQVFRKSEHKLSSFSLNNVSKHFLGDSKVDLPPWEIFNKFEGSSADRALIAEYAAKDTLLPLKLLAKLCVLENTNEMANATFCPVAYVLNRGQQIKVFSVLMRKARAMGYACPDGKGIGVQGKFTGATVLNAERGAYFDIVSGLDFSALYPSILRAWSLDYSTIVLDDAYDNLPGVEYYEVDTDQGTFRFAQGTPAVLPELLKDLAAFRKAAKKKMAEAERDGDAFAAALFNGQQLAFKITMNSAYGFTGANKGFLPCVPIAASVTATGRGMIAKTKQLAETTIPGSRVVYGDTDSVMVILNLGEDKRHDMAAHFEAAQKLADDISKTFPPPVELEFEKCYYPYCLYSRKRYAGLMFTQPDKPKYIDVKGLQLVRRDNCPLVKDVSQAILDKIMYDRSPDLAVAEARACVLRVLRHEEPLDKFVVSKALRSDYKNTAQPHLYVARKILKRTGMTVPSGARVPYVFVQDATNPDGLLAERAEDPDYVREHEELKLDVLYYIKNQLESPITALLELLVADPCADVFGSPDIRPLMDVLTTTRTAEVKTAKRVRKNQANNQAEITAFFQPAASK